MAEAARQGRQAGRQAGGQAGRQAGGQAGSSSAGRLASPDGLPRRKQVKETTGVSQPRKWAQQETQVGEGRASKDLPRAFPLCLCPQPPHPGRRTSHGPRSWARPRAGDMFLPLQVRTSTLSPS